MARPNWRRSLSVGHRFVETSLRDADRLRGDADAAAVECRQRDLETFSLCAETVFIRNATILEKSKLAVSDERSPSLSSNLPTINPGVLFPPETPKYPFCLCAGSVNGVHQGEIRAVAVGGENFVAIQDVVVAVAFRSGLNRTRIRTRAWLGQSVATEPFPAGHRRKVLFLLRGATEAQL